MRVAIVTLGCKVNQYETQALERELTGRGHTLVKSGAGADAYLINTCTVTAVSDRKSRYAIRRAKSQNPAALVAVCGCYAQTDPAAVAALGVDLISGTGDRMAFLDKLEALVGAAPSQSASLTAPPKGGANTPVPPPVGGGGPAGDGEGSSPTILVDDIMGRRAFEHLSAGGLDGRTRAMLKVEDGCANFCSYCIIPYARGPVRSLPLQDAVEEAKRLAGEGYREIILTGIEISSWADNGRSLIDLMEALSYAVPALRLRLGSLEPRTITIDFCRRAAALKNLCPHFHLSLQSGCDEVLKRMNRKYDTARYAESVKLIREYFPGSAITTDLIVGFPGETEANLDVTLTFAQQCAFSAIHVFPYSRRPGTPADKLPGQISDAVKEARAHRAKALAADMERTYLTNLIGQTLPVLFEDEKDGLWRGHAPNHVAVYAEGENLHNILCEVEIIALRGGEVWGKLS